MSRTDVEAQDTNANIAPVRTAILEVLFRAIRTYSSTSALASLALLKLEDLLPLFQQRSDRGLQALVSIGVTEQTAPGFGTVWEHTTRSTVADTQNAIAAASLVFSHSLADTAIADVCMIVADHDPSFWASEVSSRAFTLGTILERGANELLRMSIREKIKKMSLQTKVKLLRQNAGKHAVVEYPRFTFDGARLEELDTARHTIIHGDGIKTPVATRDSQEFFFGLTIYAGLVASSMLNLNIRYPDLFVEWFKQTLAITDTAAASADGVQ